MTVQENKTTMDDGQSCQPQPDTRLIPTKKPKRAHHHKVRTGCYTCRRRRVKCDEAKPLCQTCTKKGYNCLGYSKLDPIRLMVVPPPASLRGRDEHRAFQFFMETTISWFDVKGGPCLADCPIDSFWNPVVLQLTEAEPAIKHLLLAWAELHRRILFESVLPNEPFENEFFWHHQSQALRLLGSNKKIDMGVMLLACLLFCVVENFRGRQEVFLKHLQSGMRILRDYDHMPSHQKQSSFDEIVTKYIRPLFMGFQRNLSDIVQYELLNSRENLANRMTKMQQAGRVLKTWN